MQRFKLMPRSLLPALLIPAKAAFRFWVVASYLVNSEVITSELKRLVRAQLIRFFVLRVQLNIEHGPYGNHGLRVQLANATWRKV